MTDCVICYNENLNLIKICKHCKSEYCINCCKILYKNKNTCPTCRAPLLFWKIKDSSNFIKNELTYVTPLEKKFIYIRYNLDIKSPISYPLIKDHFYMFNFKNNSSNLFIGKIHRITSTCVSLTRIIVITRCDCFTYIATPHIRKFDYDISVDQICSINNNINLDNNFEKIKNILFE